VRFVCVFVFVDRSLTRYVHSSLVVVDLLVVLSPCCILHSKSSTPPFHISNMRGSKPQTGKQVERRCPFCNDDFRFNAFPAHVKKCERLKKAQEGREKYERELRERLTPIIACACQFFCAIRLDLSHSSFSVPSGSTAADASNDSHPMASPEFHTQPELSGKDFPINPPLCALTIALVSPLDSPLPANVADDPAIYHIRTEYHPSSGKAAETCPYEEYDSSQPRQSSVHRMRVADPWWPFYNTREDFLLSEVLREGNLSNDQTDKLINIIKQCLSGKGSLTFTTHADVQAARKRASLRLTPVSTRAKLRRRAKSRRCLV
jgi:hypothetical protein